MPNYSERNNPFDYCSICHNPFNTVAADNNDGIDLESKIDNIALCRLCLSQICKSPQCGVWLAKHNHWECSNCHHFDSVAYVRAYDWIFKQLNRRFDDKASVARVTKTAPINDTHPKSDDDDVMLELNGNILLGSAFWFHSLFFLSLYLSFGSDFERQTQQIAIMFWTISI